MSATAPDFDRTRRVRTSEDGSSGWLLGDARLTILTFAILGLVVIMLAVIGQEAVTTERVFFRKVSLRTNQKIADLIAQQFAQVFSNTTGLLEDMAHFPSIVERRRESVGYLFELILKRHSIFRCIYLIPIDSAAGSEATSSSADWEWFNTNVSSLRRLEPPVVTELRKGWVPSRLTNYYTVDGEPAITYACAVRDRTADRVVAILAAEIDLGFIEPVIEGAEVGRSSDVLVVDRRGVVVFSTRGFSEVGDFNRFFPVERAYETKKGGVEYFGQATKLASYTRIREMTMKPLLPGLPTLPYPTTITPREIPDWLIVVLQDSAEGTMVADRLKWNIIILLVVGAVGVFIIGRLWLDSLA